MTCAKQTIVAVIVNGTDYWVGTNWCRYPQRVCPRGDLPSGEGYELCKSVCGQEHHAEVDACFKADTGARGADLYLIGHSYCCDNCKIIMDLFGIKNIHIFR